MKKFNAYSVLTALVFSLVLGFSGPINVYAADAPVLGVAAGYSVFGNAGVTNNSTVGTTHVWGNVGGNAAGGGTGVTNLDDATQVDGSIDAGANAPVVGAISFAYGDLADEALTQIPVLDLDVPNTVTPGVYDIGVGAPNVGFSAALTLDGAGVYIFRSAGGTVARTAGGTMVLQGGATACNVFWQIADSMTFATGAGNIAGTIITNTAAITFADNGVTLQGRAWAATQVTMINTVITEPTCAAAPSSGGSRTGNINVAKVVVNDSGGTKVVSDFNLFVNQTSVISGATNAFQAPAQVYTISETNNANYTTIFSGDCPDGFVSLSPGDNKFCIVTNNDIGPVAAVPPVPPLIEVVKVPSPLALPDGPGPVKYTYTLTNIGTVPVTDITMVGDTCSPVAKISGDTNNDNKLDLNESWIYTCSTNLTETHTNTIVATGWANGISAVDIASATVVVGGTVPPLIHVTKIPSPLTLPAGGGMVTYTKKVTNPGTVALSNVQILDDKCSPVRFISGDSNSDSMLDPTETWTYTCRQNLTATTTNTVQAKGEANGMTARDIAIATVVVADVIPTLPKTGFLPEGNLRLWLAIAAAVILGGSLLTYAIRKK